jgi:AcrR family transcriptional regulator
MSFICHIDFCFLFTEHRSVLLIRNTFIMGVSERKEREKGEKKDLIRAAALKMFLEEGYAKTSIRNIADAIEYSPGTIYLYYKDKDELLYEVQAHAFGQLFQVFKDEVNSKRPLERLGQLGKIYIKFGLENPELYDLMFIIRAPNNVDEDTHKDNGESCFNYLFDCLRDCIENNLIRMTNVELASLQVWAMVHGLVSLNLRCRLKVLPSMAGDVTQILYAAVDDYINSIKV